VHVPIAWNPSLSVGIDAIDEQHKELFRRAGDFLDGMGKRSRQEVGILLSFLRTYALTHFGEEEEAMREAQYPGYARHKAQHDGFLRDLLHLTRDQEKRGGPGVTAVRLAGWVEEWLVAHVMETDRDMARFLIAHREGRVEAIQPDR
jgi:hemerythrin